MLFLKFPLRGKPAGIPGVIACFNGYPAPIDQGHMGAAHDPHPGISSPIAENLELLQVPLIHMGFLKKFPDRRLLHRLPFIHKMCIRDRLVSVLNSFLAAFSQSYVLILGARCV